MVDAMKIIDISKWQGAPDFELVAGDGVVAVICKATEGQTGKDEEFARNWSELVKRQPAMLRGAYHFARVDTDGGDHADAVAEALAFCETVKAQGNWIEGALPPALDVEWGGSAPGHAKNQDWIRAWADTVTEELGRPPMIYTGAGYWRDRVGNSDEWVHLPLWQSDINHSTPEPTPWPTWTFHQYTFEGTVAGIAGNVDMNKFNGTMEDLRALAMLDLVPDIDPGIFATFDLAQTTGPDPRVRLVQGRLLGHRYGPDGLVDSHGLPDGYAGAKTLALYSDWIADHDRPRGSVVDGQAWTDFARAFIHPRE